MDVAMLSSSVSDAEYASYPQLGLTPTHPGTTVTLHVDCGDWTCISSSHVAMYDDCATDSLLNSNDCKELFACSGHAVRVMH